jgi:hypothetical protein
MRLCRALAEFLYWYAAATGSSLIGGMVASAGSGIWALISFAVITVMCITGYALMHDLEEGRKLREAIARWLWQGIR